MTKAETPPANRMRFRVAERVTQSNHGKWKGGRYKTGGYWRVKVKQHPAQDKRGYVLEHRLVMEEKLGRYLSDEECVHHIDGNRDNNFPDNLELMRTQTEHMEHHRGKRNPNGRIVASDPMFDEIRFRLFDSDSGETRTYSLSKLIGTTFRRGKFEFRGRSTGLIDKNEKEIWESDIVKYPRQWWAGDDNEYHTESVEWSHGAFKMFNCGDWSVEPEEVEIIGNIYEDSHLVPLNETL